MNDKISSLPEVPAAYLIECRRGKQVTYYAGSTTNLRRRMKEHSAKIGSKYTASFPSIALAWWIPCEDRKHAMRQERELKKLSRAWKESLAGMGEHVELRNEK